MSSINFQGQRLTVNAITDIDMAFISQMYGADQRPIFDTQKMSQAIERIVEAICPKVPPKYYKITAIGRYLWLGDAEQFVELLTEVADCYRVNFASPELREEIAVATLQAGIADLELDSDGAQQDRDYAGRVAIEEKISELRHQLATLEAE
jgi:hypothetical protein